IPKGRQLRQIRLTASRTGRLARSATTTCLTCEAAVGLRQWQRPHGMEGLLQTTMTGASAPVPLMVVPCGIAPQGEEDWSGFPCDSNNESMQSFKDHMQSKSLEILSDMNSCLSETTSSASAPNLDFTLGRPHQRRS
uniref:Uncharacterized protein n=1 Tax=Aegilops tauschii subsp. strangulata TaxID=200361 RepID=A0A453RX04_AEGTS